MKIRYPEFRIKSQSCGCIYPAEYVVKLLTGKIIDDRKIDMHEDQTDKQIEYNSIKPKCSSKKYWGGGSKPH